MSSVAALLNAPSLLGGVNSTTSTANGVGFNVAREARGSATPAVVTANLAASGAGLNGQGGFSTSASDASAGGGSSVSSGAGSGAGTATGSASNAAANVKLSREAQALVNQLQATDRKVRAHELAHLAASGGLATSAPSYTYQRGPDGVSYAVGGEVSIDTSGGRTPEETLAKAEQVIAAALAPADPSGADQAVAAAASQRAQQARADILAEQIQENAGTRSPRDGAERNQGTNNASERANAARQYADTAFTGTVIAAQAQRIDNYA